MSSDDVRGRDELETARGYLPWMIGAVMLIFGAAKIEALRSPLATSIAFAAPIVAVTGGVYRLRGVRSSIEICALILGGLVVIAAEVCIGGGFLGMPRLAALVSPSRVVLVTAVVPALLLHALACLSGLNSRFGAWIGMASAFAWYVSRYPEPDRFSTVFTGFFVALAVGGGLGLLAGEALRRFVGAR